MIERIDAFLRMEFTELDVAELEGFLAPGYGTFPMRYLGIIRDCAFPVARIHGDFRVSPGDGVAVGDGPVVEVLGFPMMVAQPSERPESVRPYSVGFVHPALFAAQTRRGYFLNLGGELFRGDPEGVRRGVRTEARGLAVHRPEAVLEVLSLMEPARAVGSPRPARDPVAVGFVQPREAWIYRGVDPGSLEWVLEMAEVGPIGVEFEGVGEVLIAHPAAVSHALFGKRARVRILRPGRRN